MRIRDGRDKCRRDPFESRWQRSRAGAPASLRCDLPPPMLSLSSRRHYQQRAKPTGDVHEPECHRRLSPWNRSALAAKRSTRCATAAVSPARDEYRHYGRRVAVADVVSRFAGRYAEVGQGRVRLAACFVRLRLRVPQGGRRRVRRGLLALFRRRKRGQALLGLTSFTVPCDARRGRRLRNSRTSSFLSTGIDAYRSCRMAAPVWFDMLGDTPVPGCASRRLQRAQSPRLTRRRGSGAVMGMGGAAVD
jgi:hypothetical protein